MSPSYPDVGNPDRRRTTFRRPLSIPDRESILRRDSQLPNSPLTVPARGILVPASSDDWEVIFRVRDYPAWPLTNNEAERALRLWVILQKISQGGRALALLASVFITCRFRNSSPLLYLRDTIQRRRQGYSVPDLPMILAMMMA